MNHLQKVVSCLFLASAALTFSCTAPVAEPGVGGGDEDGASNETALAESTFPMTSDSVCTSGEAGESGEGDISESADALNRPPPRPPRECRRYFQCISRNNERFCFRKFPYLARICHGYSGGHGGYGGGHDGHGGSHHID